MKTSLTTYFRDLLASFLFVGSVIIVQTWLMGIAIIFLDIGLFLAFCIWAVQTKEISKPDFTALYFLGIAIQCFHFLEEFLTGFQIKFPLLFGYEWSGQLFVAFNVTWIGVLVLNGAWLESGSRLSYLLVYFYAIVGGIANGIAHLVLGIREGGYFPGLVTSPLALLVGILLLRKLTKNR